MSSLVQKKFGEAAADYAASAVHATGPSLARLVELIETKPTWRVLDIATGAGHTALAFAPQVAKVTASDITPEMLQQARKLAKERGLNNVVAAQAQAGDLPFPDTSYHLVTCRLAAHHFPDPQSFVREARACSSPAASSRSSTMSRRRTRTSPPATTASRSCAIRAMAARSALVSGSPSSARPG
ncbi:class I SAM-dependent methyltransferase [Methyloceanibacter superfactus]|uniref:class I SAM-dependent methyltransferase n=1 Tax=Methyloceanibacter superfactus TaxID=1774969 RepID=UPI000AEFBEDF|nr:class I SAM-dependent methyltransferase [Methyloceanibacter superfactus]